MNIPFIPEQVSHSPPSSPEEERSNEQPDNEPEVNEPNDRSFANSEGEYTPTIVPSDQQELQVPPQQTPEAPENIPVPDDDDELFSEVFVTESDQIWRFELELGPQDINTLRDPHPEECAFLVSAAKRQKTEVKLSTLREEEKQLFKDAKEKEIQSWLDTQTVCKILRHQKPEQQVLKRRWTLTWKDAENNTYLGGDSKSASRKAKARLVILGHQDPELSNLERDSPTLSKLSRNLLLQTCVSNRWEIGSFDIKTAFLRVAQIRDCLALNHLQNSEQG